MYISPNIALKYLEYIIDESLHMYSQIKVLALYLFFFT